MKLDSQRILLAGGAGFIGSHLAEALLAEGAKLTIVDCLDDFYSPQRKQANLRCVRAAGEYDFCQVISVKPRCAMFSSGRGLTS